ncbi:MAG: dienelactone hydrolase family protein [Parvularculaceae bacterium]
MPSETIGIHSPDGEFSAYLATPATTPAPGVLVIQEIFGVNEVMRGICDDLAADGFVALCPDLFWRLEPGLALTDKTEADRQKAFELYGKFDVDKGVEDIQAALDTLRERPECTRKAGAVGYCLGGLLAYLTAARTDCDAAVGYYGVDIKSYLGEASRIRRPLMLHIAENDEFVSTEEQRAVRDALSPLPHVVIHSYPGTGHAFARAGGAHFDAAAAALANDRTAKFFKEHLC